MSPTHTYNLDPATRVLHRLLAGRNVQNIEPSWQGRPVGAECAANGHRVVITPSGEPHRLWAVGLYHEDAWMDGDDPLIFIDVFDSGTAADATVAMLELGPLLGGLQQETITGPTYAHARRLAETVSRCSGPLTAPAVTVADIIAGRT